MRAARLPRLDRGPRDSRHAHRARAARRRRKASRARRRRPSPEQRRQMVEATVATQFETIAAAAQGCDVIVGATALQIAAPLGGGAAWASRTSSPPTVRPCCRRRTTRRPLLRDAGRHAGARDRPTTASSGRGTRDASTTRSAPRSTPIAHRSASPPVGDVRGHIFTDRPWLAADPTLAPWPDPADDGVFQTGAWILPDERPLSPELEAFLDAGEPPIYFGFGSIRAPRGPQPGDDRIGPRARAPRDRVPRVGRPVARGRRTRLPGDRRGQPAGAVPARRRRRPPRRRGHHHRGRASRRAAGRDPAASTTSTTGPNASTTSASAPRTRPARRPPTR